MNIFYGICFVIINSYAFNVAPRASHVFSYTDSSQGRPTYFGYSVGLLKQNGTSWLLVGAPRANDSTFSNIVEPGLVFKCEISFGRKCINLNVDTTKNFDRRYRQRRTVRDHAWTGATMDTSSEYGVVACAPRWKTISNIYGQKRKKTYTMQGICYTIQPNLKPGESDEISMAGLNGIQYDYTETNFYHALSQMGSSANFVKDSDTIIIGAPGLINWRGGVGKQKQFKPLLFEGNRKKRSFENTFFHPLSPKNNEEILDFDYFGYSISSGIFSPGEVLYVAGSPRGNNFFGMVAIFKMIDGTERYLIKEVKQGTQFSEYFGASVAAADLDNNGLSDLIVGAPMHSSNGKIESGCAYVFLNGAGGGEKLDVNGMKIEGNKVSSARFGTAIGTPGDLNKDGFQDLLVGAPYENDNGAVYVYYGHYRGIKSVHSQKLLPDSVSPEVPLSGFGISFSRANDIDDNYYPDFAIGSYKSGHAVIMFTRPVIAINGTLTPNPQKLDGDSRSLSIKSCIEYSGFAAPINIEVLYVIKIDSSVTSAGGVTFVANGATKIDRSMTISDQKQKCINHRVSIAANIGDYREPIKFLLDVNIKTSEQEDKDSVKTPVIDRQASQFLPALVSFITGCEKDGNPTCITDLQVSVSFKDYNIADRIVIGERKRLKLIVDVVNSKEPAFLPNATIKIKEPFEFSLIPRNCLKSSLDQTVHMFGIISCQLRNPIFDKDTLEIGIDLSSLSDKTEDSFLTVEIASASDVELTANNNRVNLDLKVKKDISLDISGFFDKENIVYIRDYEHISTEGLIRLNLITSITKDGPTSVNEIDVKVVLPAVINEPSLENNVIRVNKTQMKFVGQSQSCSISSPKYNEKYSVVNFNEKLLHMNCSFGLFSCIEIHCKVGPWSERIDSASLEATLDLDFTTLAYLIPPANGTKILVEIFAEVNSEKKEHDSGIWKLRKGIEIILSPNVLVEPEKLEWWIHLSAILGGMLVTLIISFILYKIGFFKRKKKEEIAEYRATVKRRSQIKT